VASRLTAVPRGQLALSKEVLGPAPSEFVGAFLDHLGLYAFREAAACEVIKGRGRVLCTRSKAHVIISAIVVALLAETAERVLFGPEAGSSAYAVTTACRETRGLRTNSPMPLPPRPPLSEIQVTVFAADFYQLRCQDRASRKKQTVRTRGTADRGTANRPGPAMPSHNREAASHIRNTICLTRTGCQMIIEDRVSTHLLHDRCLCPHRCEAREHRPQRAPKSIITNLKTID